MGKIIIEGLSVYACHGVLPQEKEKEQPFSVSAEIEYDFYEAAKSDDVALAVDYSKVCDILEKTLCGESRNIIETLAYECAFKITESFGNITALTVTVDKPMAPVGCAVKNVSASVALKREYVYLSIGSSMGDRKGYLDFAVESLKKVRGVSVLAVSHYIETEPYGGTARNTFLNAAVSLLTYLTPEQLLKETQGIENAAGRTRETRWGDRTLDIDIVFFGDREINIPGLIVPHPDWQNRDFVIEPLREIAPELGKKLKGLGK